MTPTDADIIRFLSGEASPDEALALDQWLSASADNRMLFAVYKEAWENGGYRGVDARKGWERFRATIATSEAQSSPSPLRRLSPLLMMAAAIVLLLVTLGLFHFSSPQPILLEAREKAVTDTLPDHSVVVLAPGARVQYTFRNAQLDGEAYFTIAPDKQSPFHLTTGDVTIRVLGTTFNVLTDGVRVKVQVSSGAIEMDNQIDSIVVKAGNTGVYDRNARQFHLLADSNRSEYAYATGVLDFQDLPLRDIKSCLEKAYGVKVVFSNPTLGNCRVTTQFVHQPLRYVLDVLASLLDISYSIKGNTIYLTGNGCA